MRCELSWTSPIEERDQDVTILSSKVAILRKRLIAAFEPT